MTTQQQQALLVGLLVSLALSVSSGATGAAGVVERVDSAGSALSAVSAAKMAMIPQVWVGMTWNIKHGCPANATTPNLQSDINVIVSQGPALISVEEVDNLTSRAHINEPSYLAQSLGMFASYHPTLPNFEGFI